MIPVGGGGPPGALYSDEVSQTCLRLGPLVPSVLVNKGGVLAPSEALGTQAGRLPLPEPGSHPGAGGRWLWGMRPAAQPQGPPPSSAALGHLGPVCLGAAPQDGPPVVATGLSAQTPASLRPSDESTALWSSFIFLLHVSVCVCVFMTHIVIKVYLYLLRTLSLCLHL